MDPASAKLIGAGLAVIGMGVVGIGLGLIFNAWLHALGRNPAAAPADSQSTTAAGGAGKDCRPRSRHQAEKLLQSVSYARRVDGARDASA